MKPVCTIFLLLIHFVVTTGFSVRTHYCMGKIETITLVTEKKDQCGVCGMDTKDNNGCCRDEIKIVKLQQDQQAAKVLIPSYSAGLYTKTAIFASAIEARSLILPVNQFTEPPVVLSNVPVYLSHGVFRI